MTRTRGDERQARRLPVVAVAARAPPLPRAGRQRAAAPRRQRDAARRQQPRAGRARA